MEKCCQSCGLPFNEQHQQFIAKESDGSDSIYCNLCYQDGKFTNPDIALDDFIESLVPHLTGELRLGSEAEVRNQLGELLPTLERWK